MKLNGHLIEDAAIKGIGPLMEEQHPDEAQALGYGTARYWYELHLVSRTGRIYSPYFKRVVQAEKEAMAKWREDYLYAYHQLGVRFDPQPHFSTETLNSR